MLIYTTQFFFLVQLLVILHQLLFGFVKIIQLIVRILNKFNISIHFYIDNQDINIHLHLNGSLEIRKVEIIDNDRYHCTATNPAGTINRYIQLNVNSID